MIAVNSEEVLLTKEDLYLACVGIFALFEDQAVVEESGGQTLVLVTQEVDETEREELKLTRSLDPNEYYRIMEEVVLPATEQVFEKTTIRWGVNQLSSGPEVTRTSSTFRVNPDLQLLGTQPVSWDADPPTNDMIASVMKKLATAQPMS